jgi:zinc protease
MSSPIPTRFPIAFERHRLDNGLTVILHPDSTLPLVAVNLWYHVGSKNERPGQTGFAHLFEHMSFQGSENVGTNEHFRLMQQVGGVANGSTWFDRTNYYETVPTPALDLALWLEADRMGFLLPAVNQQNLDTQRQVVLNERRQRMDNKPYGRSGELLHNLLYPEGHPYRWPVIGYAEDIEAASLEDVRQFFSTYYVPNNAVLTLAGDFSAAEGLASVERFFGDIPAGPPVPPVAGPAVDFEDERRLTHEDDVRLPRVSLGFRVPAYGQHLWYTADLTAELLTGGKSSRLYRELVYDRQIAQDVTAYVNPFELVATFGILSTARPGVDVAAVEEALTRALERLATEPPSADELEGARNRVLVQFFGNLQKLDTRADLLSQFTTYFDDPAGTEREAERYLGVTAGDVADLAREYLSERGRAVLHIVPRTERPS